MIRAAVCTAVWAGAAALNVRLAFEAGSDLRDGGGYRVWFGPSSDEFPLLGDYRAQGGPHSPFVLPLQQINETFEVEGRHKVGSTIRFEANHLPSCTNITFAATAYHGNTTQDVPFPCQSQPASDDNRNCLESAQSNMASTVGSSAENTDCRLDERAAGEPVPLTCTWREGVFGGSAANFWRLHYVFRAVAHDANVSSEYFDGTGAAEGDSPFMVAAGALEQDASNSELLSTKLTLPAATEGRVCFYARAACADTEPAALDEIAMKRIYNATCVTVMAPGEPRVEDKPLEPEPDCEPGSALCPCDPTQLNPPPCGRDGDCRGEPPVCIERMCAGKFGCDCLSDLTCTDGSRCAIFPSGLAICVNEVAEPAVDDLSGANALPLVSAAAALLAAAIRA